MCIALFTTLLNNIFHLLFKFFFTNMKLAVRVVKESVPRIRFNFRRNINSKKILFSSLHMFFTTSIILLIVVYSYAYNNKRETQRKKNQFIFTPHDSKLHFPNASRTQNTNLYLRLKKIFLNTLPYIITLRSLPLNLSQYRFQVHIREPVPNTKSEQLKPEARSYGIYKTTISIPSSQQLAL